MATDMAKPAPPQKARCPRNSGHVCPSHAQFAGSYEDKRRAKFSGHTNVSSSAHMSHDALIAAMRCAACGIMR
eukprot:CAMPEP_0181181850 /NCGR_PEP_ID=MMETSP1096-20121128/7560_1 /TAXON_ID=156174 ORGANISM="Chrysochromulina ericina, Strain CCMP281" /NCGR_SAMPLE_ID=MMETSP1096 /ASSEMBLY_ACC=CAM_ASM_000453 /LENGTH=72 /DNA_ID=CAMNT_0023270387 /DNA_START=864 /DNA_END=1082 /DNA_ORIENTATION=-